MKSPLQITARDFELSPAIEAVIKEKVEKLDKFYDRIIRFKVVLESPHRSKRKGRRYHVHIDISVPGEELVVRREPHEDLAVAIREAFEAAKRQLQEFADLRRAVLKNPSALSAR